MILLSGKNWSGRLQLNQIAKVHGQINGYSWYFQLKNDSWSLEIAEDQTIEPNDLPLVGYGCAGWLYQSKKMTLPDNEADLIHYINESLLVTFSMYNQNKLKYFPTVTSACND